MPELPPYFLRGSTLPILVSLWMLIRLWREGELFGTKGTFLGAWFVLAAAIQLFAPTVGIWILGLLAQVGPAIVLVLKERIDNIF